MDDKNKKLEMMLTMEYFPTVEDTYVKKEEFIKYPISELSTLGVGFSNLLNSTRTVTQSIDASGLYRAVLPKGAVKLAQAKDGLGALGTAFDQGNHLIGQARFVEAGNLSQITTIPYDLAMLFMAIALMNIEKKLDNIQETQESILNFLENKEKAKLKANLDTLSDILNNYKYNWDNSLYKMNKEILVQQINNEARESINFHQKQINEKLHKKSYIHFNKEVKNKINKIVDEFKDYQMALYVFAFSSFVDVMLIENYNKDYLTNISKTIEHCSLKYRELYTECYNQIEKYARSSIESQLLHGLADISKKSGDLIAKIPVISKSSIDENLIETGDKLKEFDINKIQESMKQLVGVHNNSVRLFIDNIDTINTLYNNSTELLMDKEYIYIKHK